MTIFNVGGGGGNASDELTFKEMLSGPYNITAEDWPDNVTQIINYFRYYDPNIREVEVADHITSVAQSAFARSSITKIKFDNIVTFGNSIFSNCASLNNVTLPNGLTTISPYMFERTTSLQSLILPSSITSIGNSAFYSSGLKNINLPYGLTMIDQNGLRETKITSISIPSTVTSINTSGFGNSYYLTDVTIDNNSSLTIGGYAFNNLGTTTNKTTFRLLGATPPTIQSTTFQNAHFEKIIVPQGSLTTYQTATNWSAYASYMEEAT